ncbi:hypothetical protein E2C01_081853 [Portunus trituberculatus]|uniref:Uncharacterized protein n=1 Tax=Portunus trituberculatus TaxID=210409 RepID=A0A5B7IWZ5_PORTR|nr:hypothetical protein [Portunus trituberculatus]
MAHLYTISLTPSPSPVSYALIFTPFTPSPPLTLSLHSPQVFTPTPSSPLTLTVSSPHTLTPNTITLPLPFSPPFPSGPGVTLGRLYFS